jgi:hypothetical protein
MFYKMFIWCSIDRAFFLLNNFPAGATYCFYYRSFETRAGLTHSISVNFFVSIWRGFTYGLDFILFAACTNLTVNWRLSCKPSQSCSEKMLVLQFISRRLSHLQIFALPFLLFLGCRKQIYIICIRSKEKQELNSS